MTNGYIVLTKGDSKLYQHAVEAINLGKPIYFVDAENKTIYFGNTIALSGSDVVITAGNSTVTIESDNDVTVTTSGGGVGFIHTCYGSANFYCSDEIATFTLTSNDDTPLTTTDIVALIVAEPTLIIHTLCITDIAGYDGEPTLLDIEKSGDDVVWGDRVISGETPDINWFYDVVSKSL